MSTSLAVILYVFMMLLWLSLGVMAQGDFGRSDSERRRLARWTLLAPLWPLGLCGLVLLFLRWAITTTLKEAFK